MLYHLLTPYAELFPFLNLFNYLTFRTGGAIMTALLITFLTGPSIIRGLRGRQQKGQPIRDVGPETHFTKVGTPTMGGLMVLFACILSTLLWARLSSPYLWITLAVIMGFGLIGFIDDYSKVKHQHHAGISGRTRLLLQITISLVAYYFIRDTMGEPLATGLAVPFLKDTLIPLGVVYFLFAAFVVTGSANAVNLTDGLDGLAIMPVMIAVGCFGFITYMVSNAIYADYLQLHFVPGSEELSVLCGAMIGAGLGFLWYNAPPAMVFMGDTGALAMGAGLGVMSVITKHEIVLSIIGGLFVLETVSVIVQVASFKLIGKRVFRMAPLHHHFEKKGWSEPTIVIRFWIIAFILALIGLSTLKIR